jgi:tetratricopeptide (TPR) repeat protein
MKTVRISEIEPIRIVGGKIRWHPIRRTLGIEAFGINAYTANAGEEIVETHDETGSGAGHHEELYVVVSGRAEFTVGGDALDAPAGTLVFLDDPAEKRGALVVEDGTTVLAIGGARGEAFRVSPWEYYFAAIPAWEGKRWDEALVLLREGLEHHPGNPSMLYNLGCLEAGAGELDAALAHIGEAVAANPKLREIAERDPDLDPLRDDPRFSFVLEPLRKQSG